MNEVRTESRSPSDGAAFQSQLLGSFAALEQFLAEIGATTGCDEILQLTLKHLASLIPFRTAAFYCPAEGSFEFTLRVPLAGAPLRELNSLVEQSMASGVFGWALKYTRPAAFSGADGQSWFVLAALRTRQRVLGMFAAIPAERPHFGWDTQTLVLATHLACAADAILTEELTIELQEHNRNLDSLVQARTRELKKAKEAAEIANRTRSATLAGMSHELCPPLNGILSCTQTLLAGEPLSASQKAQVETIRQSGERLLSLIYDVLKITDSEPTA